MDEKLPAEHWYRRWFGRRARPTWSASITRAFPDHAELMRRATDSDRRRYRRSGRWHAFWHRSAGLLEILLSVSFPIIIIQLSHFAENERTLIFTGISVAIALVAAVRAFYNWSDNWRLFQNQQLALVLVVRRWELALLRLLHDDELNSPKAFEATEQAIADVNKLLEHEQDTFFGALRLPSEFISSNEGGGTPASS